MLIPLHVGGETHLTGLELIKQYGSLPATPSTIFSFHEQRNPQPRHVASSNFVGSQLGPANVAATQIPSQTPQTPLGQPPAADNGVKSGHFKSSSHFLILGSIHEFIRSHH